MPQLMHNDYMYTLCLPPYRAT